MVWSCPLRPWICRQAHRCLLRLPVFLCFSWSSVSKEKHVIFTNHPEIHWEEWRQFPSRPSLLATGMPVTEHSLLGGSRWNQTVHLCILGSGQFSHRRREAAASTESAHCLAHGDMQCRLCSTQQGAGCSHQHHCNRSQARFKGQSWTQSWNLACRLF